MKGFIFVVFIALVCCAGAINRRQNEESLETILNKNFTEFVKALNSANPALYTIIKNANTPDLTLFVPTDAAFKSASGITNLTDTLNYHVHQGVPDVGSFYLKNFFTLPTLYVSPKLGSPQVLSFSTVNATNATYINYQAQIIGADIIASNGIIHVIDQVLKVPYESVVEAARTGSFSQLQYLVKIANFTDPENTKGVTLLAPTDEAFSALFVQQPILKPYFLNNKLPSVKATIQNLLTKHLVKPNFYPGTLANGSTVLDSVFGTETIVANKVNDTNITVALREAKAVVAQVTVPNLLAADGVSHGINQVLTVAGQGLLSLSDILFTLNATNYISRLNATGLISFLDDSTPRTYFVPTDSVGGVSGLNASDIQYGVANLANVAFTGTFVDSLLLLASLDNAAQQLYLDTTLVNNVSREARVNRIIATGPAITNKGSYVYAINTLLTVPGVPENVLNAAGENNFTAFTSLYSEKTLSGNNNLYNININRTTLFVPTNEAFAKLPLGVVGYLRMNDTQAKQYAVEILNNHIVDERLLYNVPASVQLVNANKQALNLVKTANGKVTLNSNINVHPVPLLTNNGAAFAVDDVIVPNGIRLTAEEILQGLAFENTTGESLGKYYTSLKQYDQTGLIDLLRSSKPFTLFVYTDAAWDSSAQTFSTNLNDSSELQQLKNILDYGIIYGDSIQDLNKSNVLHPGNNTNITLTVTQAGPDEKTKVTLKTPQGSYDATVVVSTVSGYNQAIYGLDRVLGVDTKNTSKGNKLPTWAWVVIIVGGILIGLLILAVIVGAAWYLFVRPNREGYRHIN